MTSECCVDGLYVLRYIKKARLGVAVSLLEAKPEQVPLITRIAQPFDILFWLRVFSFVCLTGFGAL